MTTNHGANVPELDQLPPMGSFGTVLLDLDGTVYVDGDPLPGAAEFISLCVESGCLVSYVTNLSLWPKSHCLDALEAMGLPTTPSQVLTASDVLMTTLDGHASGRDLGVLAADHVMARLEIAGYRVHDLNVGPASAEIDALVIGQVPELTEAAPENTSAAISAGVPVFASSTQGQMPTRLEGVLSAAQVLEHVLAGRSTTVIDCGKPSNYYSAAIDELIEMADPIPCGRRQPGQRY